MRAPREKTFSLRLSAEEWKSAHALAAAEGLTLSDYLRSTLRRAARRTDAADVPTAEARALAARECLAGLVGYAAGDATRYITTSRPGAVIEVQEHRLSPEERKALDFGRKPFGGGAAPAPDFGPIFSR